MDIVSEGLPGREVDAEWNGRLVRTWVPALLGERRFDLSGSTIRAGERACAALRLSELRMQDYWEPMARLLLRNEGMASSGIEGLREPIESVVVAARTGGGGNAGWAGLHLFQQGTSDPWITWFAEVAVKAALTTDQIYDRIRALIARWEQAISGFRADHTVRGLLAHLPAHPVLSAGDVAELLGVSERSGRTALTALASCGVVSRVYVESNGSGRNRHWFAATELLNLWSP